MPAAPSILSLSIKPSRIVACTASSKTNPPHHHAPPTPPHKKSLDLRRCITSLAATAALLVSTPTMDALATEKVGEFATSGLIPVPGLFRDTVQVIALDDPGVEGVKLYYTDYSRSLVEKLSNDPFGDPSQSSVTCVATGPIVLKDPSAARQEDGQEIFSELKTLNLLQNKRLRIRRIYDEKNNALVYVTYNTRFSSSYEEGGVSSSRYRTSICALPLSSTSGTSSTSK